jgi:prokaryotic ubiquitin-like protein Pup
MSRRRWRDCEKEMNMAGQEQQQPQPRDSEVEEEVPVPPAPAEGQASASTQGVDDLLDEIDGVLESNAEEFVRAFVQKGGQ